MSTTNTLQWQEIAYGRQNQLVPNQRWGHRMVMTNQDELVMFGGFGGSASEGKYLNDVWIFDLSTYSWLKVETTGCIPENRSNYSIHFNSFNNEIIIFGGGSDNKARFNTVCILDWTTKVWRIATPSQSDPSPWERTYHSSDFNFPYLIVFGGESASNMDLDDMWTFNVITEKWRKLEFTKNGVYPTHRRFQSSVLLNGYFYVIGGCTDNYELLGDMYRVDLTNLIQYREFQEFSWQKLISDNKLLERWGHSSDVFEGKIYCFGGRTSSTTDNNDIYVYDPSTATLKDVTVSLASVPKPRRRHASALVGNSLLVFGGYDGKYLKDFHYISLKNEKNPIKTNISLVNSANMQGMHRTISELERTINESFSLRITKYGKQLAIMASDKKLIQTNPFFKHMAAFSNNSHQLEVELPPFCDVLTFRIIHLAALEKQLVISKQFKIESFSKLLKSIQYFCFSDLLPVIEEYLISIIEVDNCLQLLHSSVTLSLPSLKVMTAQAYLTINEYPLTKHSLIDIISMHQKDFRYHHHNSPQDCIQFDQKDIDSITKVKLDIFDDIYKLIKFDLEQIKIRENGASLLSKAGKKIKRFFSKRQQQTKNQVIVDQKAISSGQTGCLSKLIGFVSSLCTSNQAQQGEAI